MTYKKGIQMLKYYYYIRAWIITLHAGLIATRCPQCVIDDVNEEIVGCWRHRTKILMLSTDNNKYYEKYLAKK